MSDVTPRFAAFRRDMPDAPLYAYMAWVAERFQAFHDAQRHAGHGHGWQDTHDCVDCACASRSGEFDLWLESGKDVVK